MTITWETTLSTEFSKQEYWSLLPFPPPGDLLNPRIEQLYPELQADSSPSEPPWKPKKRREVKGKGERKRYTQLNAEFQRTARRDKKAFLSEQCKKIEENNRMRKTRGLFKKTEGIKRTFHARMDMIKDRNDKDLTETEESKKRCQEYTEELYSWNQDCWKEYETTLMKENQEELNLLMKVKEESEKPGLKVNIHKTKIIASGAITSCKIDGEKIETVMDFIFLGSKITADMTASTKLRDV